MHFIGMPKSHIKVNILSQNGTKVQTSERDLVFEDALAYLDEVRRCLAFTPRGFETFMQLMRDFKDNRLDSVSVVGQVKQLLADHPGLLAGNFLIIIFLLKYFCRIPIVFT
jgi:histone deacetylase complex regulatory component SIN3